MKVRTHFNDKHSYFFMSLIPLIVYTNQSSNYIGE